MIAWKIAVSQWSRERSEKATLFVDSRETDLRFKSTLRPFQE